MAGGKGELLHVRLFLEGIEVPVISATISAHLGSTSAAQIEIVPTDRALYFAPRTMVHLFYLDYNLAEHTPATTVDSTGNVVPADKDDFYKLLWMGELFSISYNKSGFGSRGVVLQCNDFSNQWDTNWLYTLRFKAADMGSQYVQDQSNFMNSLNNIFDDIQSTPAQVIADLVANRQATLHPALADTGSVVGGLLAVLECVGGVHGYYYGINDFATIQERRVRLMEQMGADGGETAAALFSQQATLDFLTNKLQDAGQVVSFRQLLGIICSYIYYDIAPQPTGYYIPGTRAKPRLDMSLLKRRGMNKDFAKIVEDIRAEIAKIKTDTRDGTGAVMTTGYRTLAERNSIRRKQGKSTLTEPPDDYAHDWGFAADISTTDVPWSFGYLHDLEVKPDAKILSNGPVYYNARVLIKDGKAPNREALLLELGKIDVKMRETVVRLEKFFAAYQEVVSRPEFKSVVAWFGVKGGGGGVDPVMRILGLGGDPVHIQLIDWKTKRDAESAKSEKASAESKLIAQLGHDISFVTAVLSENKNPEFGLYTMRSIKEQLQSPGAATMDAPYQMVPRERIETHLAQMKEQLAALELAHYGKSDEEFSPSQRERLITQILRPDVWAVAPPSCNVLFPEEYSTFSFNRDMMMEVTRLELTTMNQQMGSAYLATSYYAPTFSEIASLSEVAVGTSNIVTYPHEIFTGTIPRMERMTDVSLYTKADEIDPNASVEDTQNRVESYAASAAHFHFLKYRYERRVASVGGKFLPRVAVGFPMVIVSRPVDSGGEQWRYQAAGPTASSFDSSTTFTDSMGKVVSGDDVHAKPVHFLGLVNSITHTLNQGGGQTSISLSHVRSHKTGDDTDDLFAKSVFQKRNTDLSITTSSTKTKSTTIKLSSAKTLSMGEYLLASQLKILLETDPTAIEDVPQYLKRVGSVAQYTGPNSLPIQKYEITNPKASSDVLYAKPIKIKSGPTRAQSKVMNVSCSFPFSEFRIIESTSIAISVLLEEALQPPWFSEDYKNANIGTKVYKKLLGCDSIVKGAEAAGVEAAIDQLVADYSNTSNGGQYAAEWIYVYTHRPGATLKQVLYGFHSQAYGDKTGLEGLDLGDALFPVNGADSPGIVVESSLDPRAGRYSRVLSYLNELLASVGMRG